MESIGRSISSDELEYQQSSEDEDIISKNNKDEDTIDSLFQIPVNGPVHPTQNNQISTEKLESSRSISSDEYEYPQSSEDEEIIKINYKNEDIIDTLFQIPDDDSVHSIRNNQNCKENLEDENDNSSDFTETLVMEDDNISSLFELIDKQSSGELTKILDKIERDAEMLKLKSSNANKRRCEDDPLSLTERLLNLSRYKRSCNDDSSSNNNNSNNNNSKNVNDRSSNSSTNNNNDNNLIYNSSNNRRSSSSSSSSGSSSSSSNSNSSSCSTFIYNSSNNLIGSSSSSGGSSSSNNNNNIEDNNLQNILNNNIDIPVRQRHIPISNKKPINNLKILPTNTTNSLDNSIPNINSSSYVTPPNNQTLSGNNNNSSSVLSTNIERKEKKEEKKEDRDYVVLY